MIHGPSKWGLAHFNRSSKKIDMIKNPFLWKYVLAFSLISMFIFSVVGTIQLYFVYKNYNLFEGLAYEIYPQFVTNLHQELVWLSLSFAFSILVCFVVIFWISKKFTDQVLSPINRIEDHLKLMMLGKWDRIYSHSDDNTDDYQSIKHKYEYFYRSLKSVTEIEVDLLKRISIDPDNRDSYQAWKNLIESKLNRLGFSEIDFDQFHKELNKEKDNLVAFPDKNHTLKKKASNS